MAAAFAVLDERLRGGRLAELAQDFGVCGGVLGPDDGAELAASAADVFMAAAQYNSEALPGAHVAPVCALMTDAARGDPYRRLVALNRVRGAWGLGCGELEGSCGVFGWGWGCLWGSGGHFGGSWGIWGCWGDALGAGGILEGLGGGSVWVPAGLKPCKLIAVASGPAGLCLP